jgi:hypothetical protein
MKKLILISSVLISFVFKGSEPVYYGVYTPVFMTRSEMEKAVRMEAATPIKNPGKIYLMDPYIFINEKFKGYHVIDNSDPSHPVNKAFIHLDGSLDLAIKGSVMYTDNSTDLVALSFNADFSAFTISSRITNAFPEPSSPDGYWNNRAFEKFRPKNGIIVRWELNQ